MFDTKTNIFLGFFFGIIFVSICYTYVVIVVQKDFTVFTDESAVPLPVDMYYSLYETVVNSIPGLKR